MEKKSALQESFDEAAASKYSYAKWRTDKAKVPGFSHELISDDTAMILDRTDLDSLEAYPFPGIDTCYKCIKRNLERMPNNDVLGTRVGNEYEWLTWRQVDELNQAFSQGVMAENLCPQVEAEGKMWRFMGIQSKNRKEWMITNMAGMYQSITTVAFYDTLGEEATEYMCWQTELTTITMSADIVPRFCQIKKKDAKDKGYMKKVENLIVFEDKLDEEVIAQAKEADLKIYFYKDIIATGREIVAKGKTVDNPPGKEDVFMFSYTSGTTGVPKGVKLSHKMIMLAIYAVNSRIKPPMSEEDSYISYLPASHSFEQCLFACTIIYGMKCGFYSGDVQKLTEDVGILKPSIFPSVPRLYNRIYDKIKAQFDAATGPAGWLARHALQTKLDYLRSGSGLTHMVYDRLVFKRAKESLGGNLRLMITASAPIAKNVLDFLKICFSCDICEGYGMTETCGGSVVTYQGDPQTGIVGGPLQNVKIKLKDIPEMNYMHTNPIPTGEIHFFGPSITSGYFKNTEKTKECITDDGWLASGDVGAIMPNGSIKIIDRAKNIFKLSQGEYIAPEKLENVYVQCTFALQAWLYGESLRDYVILFLTMDPVVLKKWAESKGLENKPEDLCKNEDLIQTVLDELWQLADKNKFNPLERPKQIMLLPEAFTIENDYLTPTMKMKRNVAKVKMGDTIEAMYKMPVMLPSHKKKK